MLLDLQAATPAITSASSFARIVQEHATLRGLIGAASEMAEIGYSRLLYFYVFGKNKKVCTY